MTKTLGCKYKRWMYEISLYELQYNAVLALGLHTIEYVHISLSFHRIQYTRLLTKKFSYSGRGFVSIIGEGNGR